MRLDLNLATHPYEDARRFYSRAGIALAVAVVLAAILTAVVVRQSRSASALNAQLENTRQEIAGLEQEETQARAILNQPENRGTRDQSAFINGLLAERAFSWTQVFADLEKIMPTRVHVVSINPELKSNQLAIKLIVAGDSRDKALELVQALESSKHFRNPQVLTEETKAAQPANPDTIAFELTAEYLPELPQPAAGPAETADARKR